MQILAVFDEKNYDNTETVLEKYTIRGIVVRDGKIAMQCSRDGEFKIPGTGRDLLTGVSKGSAGGDRDFYYPTESGGAWRDHRDPEGHLR